MTREQAMFLGRRLRERDRRERMRRAKPVVWWFVAMVVLTVTAVAAWRA